MVTIDLNAQQQWDELLKQVEAGEVLRLVRGDREVAVVTPSAHDQDQVDLDAWAADGLKQLSDAFPPNEFADWKQPDGTR